MREVLAVKGGEVGVTQRGQRGEDTAVRLIDALVTEPRPEAVRKPDAFRPDRLHDPCRRQARGAAFFTSSKASRRANAHEHDARVFFAAVC